VFIFLTFIQGNRVLDFLCSVANLAQDCAVRVLLVILEQLHTEHIKNKRNVGFTIW